MCSCHFGHPFSPGSYISVSSVTEQLAKVLFVSSGFQSYLELLTVFQIAVGSSGPVGEDVRIRRCRGYRCAWSEWSTKGQWRLKRRRPETEGGEVSRRVSQFHARSASPTFGVVSRRVCLVAPLCGSTHSECLVLGLVSFWNLLLYVFPLDGVSMFCHGAG